MVPPVPHAGIWFASASEATIPVIVTGMLLFVVAGDIANVAVATTPFEIGVRFTPNTRHVVDPLPEQLTVFPAAVAVGPAVTVTLVTSAG
jgi:hypothetical protein